MIISFSDFKRLSNVKILFSFFILLDAEWTALQTPKFDELFARLKALSELIVVFSKIVQFHLLVLSEIVTTLICVWLVLTHVLIPSFSEFCKLFSLYMLNVQKFLILALLHILNLSYVLNLCQFLYFLLASFGFKIVQLFVTLINVILQQSLTKSYHF